MSDITRVAVLDDWQGVARGAADWAPLQRRAEVVFFSDAFADQDDAAANLADFDIVLSMRERTPLPGSLINRLPKLRMLGITGARNLSLDTPACTARGIPVSYTQGGVNADSATAELALGLLISAARGLTVGDAKIRAGGFQRGVPVGMGLAGKTLGLIGLGSSAATWRNTAKALRMNVIAWSQNLTAGTRRGGRSGVGFQGRADVERRCHQYSHGAVGSEPGADRALRHRADEAGGDPGEHLPRADCR